MDVFIKELYNLTQSIEFCLSKNYYMQALILIYSGIDNLAWLCRKDESDVTKNDYIQWINTYVKPEMNLGCKAIDLYAARCSTLHTYTSESRLSRNGKAKIILYKWKKADKALEHVMGFLGYEDRIVIEGDKLKTLFFAGMGECLEKMDFEEDEAFKKKIGQRYSRVPEECLEIIDNFQKMTNDY
jgi:hypothetical protein